MDCQARGRKVRIIHHCETLYPGGFIQRLLLAFSFTSPRDDTAPTTGFEASQAETGGKGHKSTSRVVHRRWVLPAAIAGVRCR
jgi:hypothetical protein